MKKIKVDSIDTIVTMHGDCAYFLRVFDKNNRLV